MGSALQPTGDTAVSDPDKWRSSQGRLSGCAYAATLYFITVGVLYLWGYWSTFGINILQYMTLGDALKMAAYPIASGFISVAVGVVLSSLTGLARALPPGGGRNTAVGRELNRLKGPLIIVYSLAVLAIALYGNALKWIVLPLMVAPPVSVALDNRGFLASISA